IYQNIDKIQAGALRTKLVDGKDLAIQSKHLATIKHDVPMAFDFAHCQLTQPNIEPLHELFNALEFKTMIGRLPKVLQSFSEDPKVEIVYTEELSNKTIFLQDTVSKHFEYSRKIIISEAEFESLLEDLKKQKAISLFIDTSSVTTSEERRELDILGYAIA